MVDITRRILIAGFHDNASNITTVTSTVTGTWQEQDPAMYQSSALLGSPTSVNHVDWSERGNYVAITHVTQPGGIPYVEARRYNKSLLVVGSATANNYLQGDLNSNLYRQAVWSPDTRYLATIADTTTGGNLSIWYRSGDDDQDAQLSFVANTNITNHVWDSINWHPDGTVIVAMNKLTGESFWRANVIDFTSNTLTVRSDPFNITNGSVRCFDPKSVAFNHSGTRLVFTGNTGNANPGINIFDTTYSKWRNIDKKFTTPISAAGTPVQFTWILGNLSSTSDLPTTTNTGESWFIGANLWVWNAVGNNTWYPYAVSSLDYTFKTFNDGVTLHPDVYSTGQYGHITSDPNDSVLLAETQSNALTNTYHLEAYQWSANSYLYPNNYPRGDTFTWTRQAFPAATAGEGTGTLVSPDLNVSRDGSIFYRGATAFEANSSAWLLNGVITGLRGNVNIQTYDLLLQSGSADLVSTAGWLATWDRQGRPGTEDFVYVGPGYWQEGYCVVDWVGSAALSSTFEIDRNYVSPGYATDGYFQYLSAIGTRIKGAAPTNLTSTASITARPTYIYARSATLSSSATLSALGGPRLTATASLSTSATVVVDGVTTSGGLINLATQATMQVLGNTQRDQSAALDSAAIVTAAAQVIRDAQANLDSVDFATIDARPIRRGLVYLESDFAVSATGVVIKKAQAQVESAFLVSATGVVPVITRSPAALSAQFLVDAQALRTAPSQAGLSAESTWSLQAGLLADAQSVMSAETSYTVSARKLELLPENRILVTQESRTQSVLPEARRLSVPKETRVNTILPESRALRVSQETRVLEVS